MTDTQPQAEPVPQVNVVPLATTYKIQNVDFNGRQHVMIIFTTPAGQNVYWFDGDALPICPEAMTMHGRQAATDLVVPKTGLFVPGQ
jgi:hypothetical protein